MKKLFLNSPVLLLLLIVALSGCGTTGEKAASLSVIYGIMAVFSLFLLIGYCSLVRKKDPWFLLLFSSVLIVNIGYSALAVSRTLEEALLANRISYLGSVCLPLSMLMIILNVCKINYKKWISGFLLAISIFVFAVAASPGYLDIYYKEVSLEIVDGVSRLYKIYGPWHSLYFVYLFGYFGAMITAIFQSAAKQRLESAGHAAILIVAVFVNIGVWFIEQFVKIDFEILSVSYIISELFLLGLHLMLQEQESPDRLPVSQDSSEETHASPVISTGALSNSDKTPEFDKFPDTVKESYEQFLDGIRSLTPTEHTIYEFYLEKKTTKEILELLNIKENTLKFHNKNIYSKLGVSSRKQLLEVYNEINSVPTD